MVDYVIVDGAKHLCRDDLRSDNNRRRLIDEIAEAEAEDGETEARVRAKSGRKKHACVRAPSRSLHSGGSRGGAVIWGEGRGGSKEGPGGRPPVKILPPLSPQ